MDEIISNLGSRPAPMTTYLAPLRYIVLGLSAIVLLIFCSVTSRIQSESIALGNMYFFFFFCSQHCVTCRFYIVDGKLAGTCGIVKAISKLSSWIIHNYDPSCLCTARLANMDLFCSFLSRTRISLVYG